MLSKVYPKSLVVLVLLWISAAGSGFLLLGAYDARPGGAGTPPPRWPEGCPIPLDRSRPTLLIFLHPRCPCSRASVAELASIEERFRGRFAAHAILFRPGGPSAEWDRAGRTGDEGPSLPGFRRWSDPGGQLGRRFGVETSGHVLLFDPGGGLLFGGGITPSRGRRGENPGLESLAARIEGVGSGPGRSPTFGCPILEPGATSREERTR